MSCQVDEQSYRAVKWAATHVLRVRVHNDFNNLPKYFRYNIKDFTLFTYFTNFIEYEKRGTI